MLAFARKQTIVPKVLDLNVTLAGMLKMLRRLIGENIEITWQPGAHVWPVYMDPTQIDQILANLCANARDAIENVGEVHIETSNVSFDEAYCARNPGFVAGEYVQLMVSDNGQGMDEETQQRVYEPFFPTRGLQTGLGLATVYGIVMQNHGFINVSSKPGQGATFNIYFLRHRGEVSPQQSAAETPKRGHETILVVEDEPELLKLTTVMLERHGYTADVLADKGVLSEGIHFLPKPFTIKDIVKRIEAVLDWCTHTIRDNSLTAIHRSQVPKDWRKPCVGAKLLPPTLKHLCGSRGKKGNTNNRNRVLLS